MVCFSPQLTDEYMLMDTCFPSRQYLEKPVETWVTFTAHLHTYGTWQHILGYREDLLGLADWPLGLRLRRKGIVLGLLSHKV